MSSLQRVQLQLASVDKPDAVLPLASKLVELSSDWDYIWSYDPAPLGHLTALTALHLAEEVLEQGQEEPPQVNPLVNLPSLHHLYLRLVSHDTHSRGWLLRGLSSVSSLRSLVLSNCYVGRAEAVCAVRELTQLTSLWLDQLPHGEYAGDRGVAFASISEAVQQLTGLQQLALDYDLLVAPGSLLLAHLQQLTQLLVLLEDATAEVAELEWPELVEEVGRPLQGQEHLLLQRLVLVGYGIPPEEQGSSWEVEVELSPLPGVRVFLSDTDLPYLRALVRPQRQMRPCPHLAGVWEVVAQG
jgi:hypothetical protein